MSPSPAGVVRRHPPHDHRIAALASLPLVFAVLAVGVASADPPPGVVQLSAAEAERAGATIRLTRQAIGGATLVQADPDASGLSLLAVAPDGATAALADAVGELSATLTLASGDGDQLRIQLPGLLAAGYAPDGAWLAVIDGRGVLWRVDAGSGRSVPLAEGPFLGSPLVEADGSVLLLSVSSVEAPYRSQLVRLSPPAASGKPISDEELVYGAFRLEDGGIAVVAHRSSGTVVRRLADGGARPMANLGPGAIDVTVAGDGRIAYERQGQGVFLVDPSDLVSRSVADGSRPCFGPDGATLLVRRGDGNVVLATDGSVLATAGRLAAFAGSAGCPS